MAPRSALPEWPRYLPVVASMESPVTSEKTSGHRKYIFVESLASAAANVLIGFAAFYFVFGLSPRVKLMGAGGLAADLALSIFGMTLMCTFVPTLLTRSRVRRGIIAPRSRRGGRRVPRNVVMRGFAFATTLFVAVFPVLLLALRRLGPEVWTLWPLLVFKTALAIVIAMVVTPAAVFSALQDHHS